MNLYDNLNTPEVLENFETLYQSPNVLIERIVSSAKPEMKIYNQPYDEWLVLIEGRATLQIDEKKIELQRGDTFLIEKNIAHQVISTQQGTIWLCVHVKNLYVS